MELLGRLPSEMNLSDVQIKELLMYHRIKKRSHSICPDCVEEDREREKTCFVCSSTFNDKTGMLKFNKKRNTKRKPSGSSGAMLEALRDKNAPKLTDAPPEVQEKAKKQLIENLKKSGVRIIE